MRAIVLGGGGSKGSYEIGVWKALNELHIDFSIVTGTSVGALNGALMIQNDYVQAVELWSNLKQSDVITDESLPSYDIDLYLEEPERLKPLIQHYFQHQGLDITPLKSLFQRYICPEKIQNTKKSFGIVTVEFPTMAPKEIDMKQIVKEKIADYLLASASCFPAFPLCQIDRSYYMDGGYYDNLPIHLALQFGATEIIAVDLHDQKATHPNYQADPVVHYLMPSWPLGSFLSFRPEQIKNNMTLGYFDTLKHFAKLDGKRYTFAKQDFTPWLPLAKKFWEMLELIQTKNHTISKSFLTNYLLENEHTKKQNEFAFRRALELCMEENEFSPYQCYQLDAVLTTFQNPDLENSNEDRSLFSCISSAEQLYQQMQVKGKKALFSFLNFLLHHSSVSSFAFSIFSHFPRETIISVFLKTIQCEKTSK